jgi:CubicO group peptidase (beta-lactamase class C family)
MYNAAFKLLAVFLLLTVSAAGQEDLAGFRAAADYSRANRGVAMLVVKGDKTVFEEYSGTGGVAVPWLIASGTKSFAGVMLACAIEDGIVSGFDEKVSDTIAEWKTDPRRSQITLRQLLSLTSGIDAGRTGDFPTYAEAVAFASVAEPGERFQYGPVPFQVFGEVMKRKLRKKNESVLDYMERRIFAPLGMSVGFWRKRGGDPMLPSGAALTAKEWVKFGIMLRDGGKFEGRQVVKKALLDELVDGSKANPAYGITFWLNRTGVRGRGQRYGGLLEPHGDESLGRDIFMAAGAGFQRMYVIPSHGLVVVRFGAFGDFDDREFLKRALGKK